MPADAVATAIMGGPDERGEKLKTAQKIRSLVREALAPSGTNALDSGAYVLLLALAATAPFLYETRSILTRSAMGGGALFPRGDLLLELFAFSLAAATLLSRSRVESFRRLAVPVGMLLAIAVLGFVQLIPLPQGLLHWLAPQNLKIYHDSGEVLSLFGRTPPGWFPISIAPHETAGTVLLALAYAAIFLAASSLLQTRPRRRLFLGTVFTSAIVQILLPLALERGPWAGHRLHGGFLNPNHFAAYLEIVLALAFASIWTAVLTSPDRVAPGAEAADRVEKRVLPIVLPALIWGLVALGIGLTESRGGILAAAVTTMTLLAIASLQRGVRYPLRAAAGAAFVLLAGVVFIAKTAGAEPFLRFLTLDPRDLGGNTRVALWKTSLAAWREFPLLGSGLGTFREAFRRVQPRDLIGLVEQAHSDFLQLLVTGGVLGAALGLVLFGSLFVVLVRAWRRQQHREEGALALAGVGALMSLTLHGFVDFNLSIPPVAALLACVLGCAWTAASYHRSRRKRQPKAREASGVSVPP